MDINDAANAADKSDVTIASLVGIKEGAEAEGMYTVRILEAIPAEKDRYDALFALQQEALRKGENSYADELQDQLDGIEMYVKAEDVIYNTVMTLGKNDMLDKYIAGSGFTQVGPYMGLISSISYASVPVAADTMASHATWTEAGSTNAPTFTARVAPSWSAASAGFKAASTAVSFTMTGAGTLKGAFLVLGTGAVATLMSTAGILFSAGLFSGGDQVVSNGNVVQVSYFLGL
jgi:hypothetical protein